MAITLSTGIIIAEPSDYISSGGVDEMALGFRGANAAIEARSLIGHDHTVDDITDFADTLAAALDGKMDKEPIDLGSEDLDTILADGVYYQASSARATLELNYPSPMAGSLRVIVGASSQAQQYFTEYQPSNPGRYWRTYYAGSWGAWRRIADQETTIQLGTVPSYTDLNLFRTPGEYGVTGSTSRTLVNAPEGASTGVVKVLETPTSVWMQMYWSYGGDGMNLWVRKSSDASGSWTSWERILTGADLDGILDGVLDGVVAADDPRLSDARYPLAHSHAMVQVDGLTEALNGKADAAQLDGISTAYDVAVAQGYAGTPAEWLDSLVGPRGVEGPYGGTEVTDPQVASWIGLDAQTDTAAALDRAYRERVSVLEYGATGDGVTDDTAAFTAAMATGRAVAVPPGIYLVSGASTSLPLDLHLQQGATIRHLGGGAALTIAGTEHPRVPVTVAVHQGEATVTAPGHGVTPGQWVKLRSDRLYDSHSTHIPIGELVQIHAVDGDVLTARVPIQGGPYLPEEAATLAPLDMIEGVHIHGRGTIEGGYEVDRSQAGIHVSRAHNVVIEGIRTRGFDWRHIAPEDCASVRVSGITVDWAHTSGTGYGVAPTNASQDVVVDGCYFTDIRHAFTTSNDSVNGGVGRRMVVRDCHILYSRPHEGGMQGDALDTHTAAEEISFIGNTVTGSSGMGINHEARSGRIVGNLIIDPASHGIHAHNETDLVGTIDIRDNRVIRPQGDGIRVSPPTRGATLGTAGVIITGNSVDTPTGDAYRIGIDGYPAVTGVTLMGNQATGTVGAFMRILNTTGLVDMGNLPVSGNQAVIKP